jgi:LAO/AO transport system kinase
LKDRKSRHPRSYYVDGVRNGDRIILAQAISLVESSLPTDADLVRDILIDTAINPINSIRIGITGIPGVGKSTLIEKLGLHIIDSGKKLAVLSIDPSSPVTKGSILGDKTRMNLLSKHEHCFIRPSASGKTLGGLTESTSNVIRLCEAAGFDTIMVETVGVGQSEVAVKQITDFFLLLMLPNAGDELQGIKKGILEMANAIVITKADGDNVTAARKAQHTYQQAIHLSTHSPLDWSPPVLISSAYLSMGISEIYETIITYIDQTKRSGYFLENRNQQQLREFISTFDVLLKNNVYRLPEIESKIKELKKDIMDQHISAYDAAQELLQVVIQRLSKKD